MSVSAGERKMIPRGEDDILSLLDAHFPRSGKGLLLGRGDDCALLAPAALPRALTCDVFVEDSHFRTRYFTPYELGWKALAVNVSDLASAGAEPEGFSLGLTLTGREYAEWLDACFSGMADLAGRWNMALAGGDLARAGVLHFSVTAWGRVLYAEKSGWPAQGCWRWRAPGRRKMLPASGGSIRRPARRTLCRNPAWSSPLPWRNWRKETARRGVWG